jgi:acetyltransferase
VRQRYFEFVSLSDRVQHERLLRICFNDYDRDLPLAAEVGGQIVAVGRLSRRPSRDQGRLSLLIIDAYHGKGLGTLMVDRLLQIAKQEGIRTVFAEVLSENTGMLSILKNKGFNQKEHKNIILCKLDI